MAQRTVRLCYVCKRQRVLVRGPEICAHCQEAARDREFHEIIRGLIERVREHMGVCPCGDNLCEVCTRDRAAIVAAPSGAK